MSDLQRDLGLDRTPPLPTGPDGRRRELRTGSAWRTLRLDPLIHERVRLGILTALGSADRLSFTELRDGIGVTDGNLGLHARRLEEAGYVACDKRFVKRKPRSEYRLTPRGRNALATYLFQLESIIRTARGG